MLQGKKCAQGKDGMRGDWRALVGKERIEDRRVDERKKRVDDV